MRIIASCLFLLLVTPSLYGAVKCKDKNVFLKAYIDQVERRNGKVVTDKLLVHVPPTWSIHMGTFDEIYIEKKAFKDLELHFSVINSKEADKKRVKLKATRQGFVSTNFKLNSIFRHYIGFAPGKAVGVLQDKGNTICQFEFKLELGD